MAFGIIHITINIFFIDLKPYIKEDPISRKAKNMSEFNKSLKLYDRKFEVITAMNMKVSNFARMILKMA